MSADEQHADPPTPSIMQYEVTNRNDFRLDDWYDGIPIAFPPGEAVVVSPEVVLHCFGWPGELSDRALHMAKRYGWASRDMLAMIDGPGKTVPRYVALAGNIEISPIYYDLVRRSPNDPIPADTGEEGDREPVPAADTSTKVGKRRGSKTRTPVRLGASGEPRAGAKRQRGR